MQPPITNGTVLQNRYRILQILGQGGFGRTYLAEDQRRFNELCAIKELILTATGIYAGEKAQELFEREAATLYQIEHPQIPKFREKFAQDHRLFLVVDYVPGKTYRTLLSERQAINQTFSEAEVIQLIRSLLPILEHIHQQGIIHRDISPENIILRQGDGLPVLIDFGVVKELANKLQATSTSPTTTVGKLGYAPSEQMQTGRAYPSSDLYALAVTVLVLLTGKEPAEIYDETRLVWNWQQWVNLSPGFAQILQRMLNYVPSERYQSVAEVTQALQAINQDDVTNSLVSYVQTIAVGHRPEPVTPSPEGTEPVITPSNTSNNGSVLDNPLVVGAIGAAVVILAGVSSWTLVNNIRSQNRKPAEQPTPQTFPSPIIPQETATPTPTVTLTPTPTPTTNQPLIFNKRLNFDAANTAQVNDTIKENEIIQYGFTAEAGQKLTVSVDQFSGLVFTVLAPNGQAVDRNAQQVRSYEGVLPFTGSYIIQLRLPVGVAQSDYTLNAVLRDSIEPTPTPTLTLTPTPTETSTPTPTETSTPTPTETSTPDNSQQPSNGVIVVPGGESQ